jgi:hypothetical protein
MVLEKVGTNTGKRVVRLEGERLEWRREAGKNTKENAIMRCDMTSLKVSGLYL